MSASSNPLAADSLATAIASALSGLPTPQIKTTFDAIAVAAHASMLAVGFRLIGLGEDHKISAKSDSDPLVSSSESKSLPDAWNASSPNFAFRYAHSQSSMQFLLKINRMATKAVVMAMAMGHDKTTSFDVAVNDYISESSIPSDPVPSASSTSQATQRILDLFISAPRLADFGSLMRLNVIQKLIPSLQKEGYEESTTETRPSPSSSRDRDPEAPRHNPLRDDYQPPARPHPLYDPLAQPRRPFPAGELPPPGFEDPYDLNRPSRPAAAPAGGFGNLGERDLYPQGLGPRDGLWGGLGPGLGGGFGGGGMHPTFDDPLFAGGPARGGATYDPQAPPGSRFDPLNPGDAPRGNGFGGRLGGGPGSRPPNPFGGYGSGDFI